MSDKRTDQHNIDPGQVARSADEHLVEEEKQELTSNPHGQPMIPQAGVNPALHELRGKKGTAGPKQDTKGE